jgi:hypothetical protein
MIEKIAMINESSLRKGNPIFSVSTLEYLDLGWDTMVQHFLQIMIHIFKNHVDISPINVIICVCFSRVHRIINYMEVKSIKQEKYEAH